MDRHPLLIGIAGRAGAGKDTLARYLISAARREGFTLERRGLADALKDTARPLFGLTKRDVTTPEGKARVLDSGRSVRSILQDFGVGVRAIDSSAWVRVLLAAARRSTADGIIVPDIRFANEAAEMDVVLRIHRPGARIIESTHVSEAGIPFELVDVEVENALDLKSLRAEAVCVLQDWLLPRL